jgi:hypothetical protein
VGFATITLCIASQRVFIVVSVSFVIEPVRKLLDTPSYFQTRPKIGMRQIISYYILGENWMTTLESLTVFSQKV